MLVKMFEDYAIERGFGPRIFLTEYGFATYHLSENECYIEDIYVIPEKRKSRVASHMADEICKIAKSNNIYHLYGSVNKLTNSVDSSRKTLIAYGFTMVEEDDEMEWYFKEIL
jgi:ribosomal protein S18 acetylase RimI-like enzyme